MNVYLSSSSSTPTLASCWRSLSTGGAGRLAAGGVHPVGDALRVEPKMPGDAPQVGAVHTQLQGLAAHGQVVALRLWLGGIGAAALAPQGAGGVLAGTMLFGGLTQVGQEKRGSVGRSGVGYYRRKLSPIYFRHSLRAARVCIGRQNGVK